MFKAGDLVRLADLEDPASARLSQVLRSVVRFAGVLIPSTPRDVLEDKLIVVATLEDKAASTVKALADFHWTSTCIVTRTKFEDLCGGPSEASILGKHMSGCGRAKFFSVKRSELIELVWTAEKLQHQLDVIDQPHETFWREKEVFLVHLEHGRDYGVVRDEEAKGIELQQRAKKLESKITKC